LTEVNKNQQGDRRILVLGSTPHSRLITAYTWDNLPQHLNVADYDVIILNLVPFTNEEFARNIDLDLLPSGLQFVRHLFSEGSEIIAIGVPDILVGNNPYVPVDWWLPINLRFISETGEEIRDIQPDFAFYFDHIRRWCFYADAEQWPRPIEDPGYLKSIHPRANLLIADKTDLAQTRFQRAIGMEVQFRAVHFRERGVFTSNEDPFDIKELLTSGRAIWLPPPTEITAYEAINLILHERYGLQFERPAPAWLEQFKLPNQPPIEAEITRYEEEIERLESKSLEARQRLEEAARLQGILYEQGEDVLEPLVRDALRELEAVVDDPPPRKGREDGRLVDPAGRNGMLEVKGRTGTLRLTDVRQLNQWVQDALVEEDWNSKGILIANLNLEGQPGQRGEIFPSNCIGAAERASICLMTTTQLFNALCSHQRGELDLIGFWDTTFNTNGVCQLPELESPEK
jgi:hypothetical protein